MTKNPETRFDYLDRSSLKVNAALARFIEAEVLPDIGIDAARFWAGLAALVAQFTPENRALLSRRNALQARIDAWHEAHRRRPLDRERYREFLTDVRYLAEEAPPFQIDPPSVDPEVASIGGPQLVVPALNARFVLNAANARWGSLYDALYGTDALPGPRRTDRYDPERGTQVIARAKSFLDEVVPLASGRHAQVQGWKVSNGSLLPTLSDPSCFVGYRGPAESPTAVLLRHNRLHIEFVIDRAHPVGRTDPAGVSDVVLEAALTTIIDLEDSVAVVDAEDKVAAYRNWLGLMKGDLTARLEKDGRELTRTLSTDRDWISPSGVPFSLPGRSLLFVRNVGHLTTTPAVRLPDGSEAQEGILDAVCTTAIALHDLQRKGRFVNSRTGSIYIVKPKMHGPDEARFADRLFSAVEDLFALPRHTVKIGLMDEERRTSVNLAACLLAVKDRIVFVNTGFLDRTGDEIRTSTKAGPMIPKGAMKSSAWLQAYESRNVAIALGCGFSGRAQIGKGMWTAPDRMADMVHQKIAHPLSGATTAWVPSPTAATLHALHYHAVDVFARHRELSDRTAPPLDQLLFPPLADDMRWTPEEIRTELDNNVQSILGYVVRWIDQGIGCSKVPDIHDVGLMEDRATLRISSQHIANWLLHGICTSAQVEEALLRMAQRVDQQNADDPLYRPMSGREADSQAFQAARALIFQALAQPNGYTEPLLHAFRLKAKALRQG